MSGSQFNLNMTRQWIATAVDGLGALVTEAVHEAVTDGENAMRLRIESAVTPTGEARAAKGGHPGRIDSGDMIHDVSSDVTADLGPNGGEIVGRFGWLDVSEFDTSYYAAQEYGTEHIEAMGSLGAGASKASDTLRSRLGRLK